MNNKEWLIRAGALAVLMGFFLPSMTVSCSGLPGLGKTFSLADLATQADQPFLYLIPLGILVTLGLSILVSQNQASVQIMWGKVTGAGLGLVSLLFTYISLSNQLGQAGGPMFSMSPEFGLFLILGGYITVGIGLGMQWREESEPAFSLPSPSTDFRVPSSNPPLVISAPPRPIPPLSSSSAHLEVVSGNIPQRFVEIRSTEFSIGRGQMNDFQIPDSRVSRQHTRLRFAQGSWFVQDQGSTGGTYVNGQQIRATRLRSGDQLTIGNTTLVFREK